jgi:hypothetical protein
MSSSGSTTRSWCTTRSSPERARRRRPEPLQSSSCQRREREELTRLDRPRRPAQQPSRRIPRVLRDAHVRGRGAAWTRLLSIAGARRAGSHVWATRAGRGPRPSRPDRYSSPRAHAGSARPRRRRQRRASAQTPMSERRRHRAQPTPNAQARSRRQHVPHGFSLSASPSSDQAAGRRLRRRVGVVGGGRTAPILKPG